jgi:hypothetical protein
VQALLDSDRLSLKIRSRVSFFLLLGLQGAWWTIGTILVTKYQVNKPIYDWTDGSDFACGFTLVLCLTGSLQANYMFLFFVVGNLADNEEEVVRISALLRATESAAQAVSYGLNSIEILAAVGGTYINFGLWAAALLPAWLVIKEF